MDDLDPPVLLTLQDDCRACRRAMAQAALSSDIRKLFYPVVPALITQDRLQGLSAGNGVGDRESEPLTHRAMLILHHDFCRACRGTAWGSGSRRR